MKPPRGPRSVLCVVLVTKSAMPTGLGIDAGGDEPGVVRHVDHQERADRVGDRAKALPVDDPRIRRCAGDDELRLKHPWVVKTAPSVTKTLGASCTLQLASTTLFFGSVPMRAVPHSWMFLPKTLMSVSGGVASVELHRVENRADVRAHGGGHGFLVLAVTRIDVQHGNSPRVFLRGIEPDVVIGARQALALRFDAEVIRNLLAHALAPGIARTPA